jgi:hypothetical protein
MLRTVVLTVTCAALCALAPATAQASGTLKITKNIAKAGTVNAGGKISCGLSCTTESAFFANECDGEGMCTPPEVTVGATPAPGWAVSGYDGCTDGGEDFCWLYMQTSANVTVNFTDVSDPTVAIAGPVQGGTVRGNVGVTATAGDNDGVQRVELYLDNVHLTTDMEPPYEFAVNTAGVGDGGHAIAVRAYDFSGRASSVSQRSVTVDNTAPTVGVNGGTAQNALVGAPGNVPFTFAAADATSGVAKVECALEGGAWAECDSKTAHTFSGVADGAQTFLVRAFDAVGNVSSVATRDFTVDKTNPTAQIATGPAQGALTGKNVSFTFTAGDAGSGVASVKCAFDGAFTDCSAPAGHGAANLPDGPHSYAVKVTDGAGNTATATRTFKVDTAAPTVAFTSGPGAGTTVGESAVAIGFTATDAIAGVSSVECKLDGGAFAACQTPAQLGGLAHGEHTFTVRATDAAGNAGSSSRTFNVDLAAPETTIDTASTGASSAFTFSSSEPGSTFACRLYAQGATAPAFGACAGASGSHATTGLAAGTYVFEVVATDAVGHADATPAGKTFTVTAQQQQGSQQPGTPDQPGTPQQPGQPGTPQQPGGPQQPAAAEKITAGVDWKWHRLGKKTLPLRLTVSNLPAGATVELSCKGKGCPFKKKAFAYKKPILQLASAWKNKRVAAGGTVEVRIVKPGMIGKVVVFTMKPRSLPTYKVLCLAPGAAKAAAC